MASISVGVLRGGPSSEYDVSLKTGAAVLKNLPAHYKGVDILIDKEGLWHANGIPFAPEYISRKVDVVFNALHGYYGEDGKVQKMLEYFSVPYTGSGSFASAVGMNKGVSKKYFVKHGLKTPAYKIVRAEEKVDTAASKIFREVSSPWVIKPAAGGSSVGVKIARTFDELLESITAALEHDTSAIVEEYIRGREATCGVIDGFREEMHYTLPPIEIIPPSRGCSPLRPASPSLQQGERGEGPPRENSFFDYEAKYSGKTREICPSNFSAEAKKEIMRSAIEAHKAIGARHYSRSDFIVSPRGIYILEINTLPGLTEESLLPKACSAVGCSFPQILEHLITLALQSK